MVEFDRGDLLVTSDYLQSETEAAADSNRIKADQYLAKAREYASRGTNLYTNRFDLDEGAIKNLAIARSYNDKAADIIFAINNSKKTSSDEIDLFGLYELEAKYILKKYITESLEAEKPYVRIIVGKLNSQEGISTAIRVIEKICAEAKLNHSFDPENKGVVVIDLQGVAPEEVKWRQPAPHPNPQYKPQPKIERTKREIIECCTFKTLRWRSLLDGINN